MQPYELHPIGIIHTPFKTLEDMPIQPTGADEVQGTVVLDSAYEDGLKDLEGFSHVILLYQFHRSKGFALTVTPFLDDQPRGLFATRAPRRPNPIGLSVVQLLGCEDNILRVERIDVLDGTPLLDIKPFVPAFDVPEITRIGWMEGKVGSAGRIRSDDRFKGAGRR